LLISSSSLIRGSSITLISTILQVNRISTKFHGKLDKT
jgi:hypothetical protein